MKNVILLFVLIFSCMSLNGFPFSHSVWTPSKTVMRDILKRHSELSFDEKSEFISTFSGKQMTVRDISNILDLVFYEKEKRNLVIQEILQS